MPELSSEETNFLVGMATEARRRAYAPYSKYQVGAALRTENGRFFTGVNVENAAYPSTICAERSAIVSAVSQGERAFEAIAVVTETGGFPCGTCRQVMAEFGLQTEVIIADVNGKIHYRGRVIDLLPGAFTNEHLKLD